MKAKYMLDTNICIYIIKNKPLGVKKKLSLIAPEDICLSSITVSELFYGVEKSQYPQKNREALENFLINFNIMDYGYEASEAYGKIRAHLEKTGDIIGAMDLMISAHALSLKTILVTNNMKEFKKVEGLKIENWYL
jgi:tRNA(fMet)-specific endonuclease VapC